MNSEPDMFAQVGNVAQVSIIERWQWYHRALKDPALINGKTLLVHPGEYELGYYRMRDKGGQWKAVGIYPNDEGLVGAQIAERQWTADIDLPNLFTRCCRHPISYEAFVKAIEGGGFDDEPPAQIGDNSGDADPLEALRLEFIGEKEQADEILKKGIKSQADADRASIWKDRLLNIRARAQAMFKSEKQPVLDEGKRIDDKYRPLAHEKDSEPTEMIEKLRLGMDAFLREQKRIETERQRIAQEEAERARRAAEEAAQAVKTAILQNDQAAIEANAKAQRLADEAAAAERDAQARKVSAGRTGARTTMRTVKVGVVTDYAKAATALLAMKHPDFMELIYTLAQRAAKANMPFDGMEVREEQKVV